MLPELGDALVEFAPLLGRQHLGCITKSLRKTLAGCIGKRELLGAQSLNGGPIDGRLRQKDPSALARGNGPLPHRQQVFDGTFDDGSQLVLLIVACIDLDGQMSYGPVSTVL